MLNSLQDKSLKPPLKWAGGKRWLVPYLLRVWEKFSTCRLIEPFCGGLAIALSLVPEQALLNDINPHLINFYKWLKKGLYVTSPMRNLEKMYYNCRKRFNNLIKEKKANVKEAAELFYYLNRTGYNGLCRFNSSGAFNVPFGQYKTINYTADFYKYKELFSKWMFTCDDFENLIVAKSDFIYADPPYDVKFTKYSKEDFNWNDQVRLAKWLSKQSCSVVVSNQATPQIIELYKKHDFNLLFVEAPRMISCTGDRTPAKEVIATRNV